MTKQAVMPKADDSQSPLVEIVASLHQHRCGVIVGAHGSGKTTLLHSLRPVLRDAFAEIENVQTFGASSVRRSRSLPARSSHRPNSCIHGKLSFGVAVCWSSMVQNSCGDSTWLGCFAKPSGEARLCLRPATGRSAA